MNSEHVIGSQTYRVGRLNARQQLHIVRRIMPVFANSAPMLLAIWRRMHAGEQISVEEMTLSFGSGADAFKSMSDADVDYVVSETLSVVVRRLDGGTGWGPVIAPNGMIVYADISWSQTLQLVWLVIKENVLNFFNDAPSASTGGAQH